MLQSNRSSLARPKHLKSFYARAVLVACDSQLDGLSLENSDALVVTTDWILWRRWIARGGHALHIDHFLGEWPPKGVDINSFHMTCANWVYDEGGEDFTCFEGVSLGRLFSWETTAASYAYFKLWHAINRLVSDFSIQKLELRGLRVEYDFLKPEIVVALVSDLCESRDIAFVPNLASANSSYGFPEKAYFAEFSPSRLRDLLRKTYEWLVDLCFSFAPGAERRPVLILHNWLVVKQLALNAKNAVATLALPAASMPKSLGNLMAWWKGNVLLYRLPEASLSADEQTRLADIAAKISRFAAKNARGLEAMVPRVIGAHVDSFAALPAQALLVKRYALLFDRLNPARLLIGDAENGTARILMDLAKGRGIPVDELPNGMFLSAQRYDTRVSDGRVKPAVSRLLAWGAQGAEWHRHLQTPTPVRITGYPAIHCRDRAAHPAPAKAIGLRALVLPTHVDRSDLGGLRSDTFAYLADAIEVVRSFKPEAIRVKVHPGFHNADYYARAIEEEGLSADVFKEGPLAPHVEWADIIIGPVNSGAMVETLAMGKPYYPVVMQPSSIELDLCVKLNVSKNATELHSAIAAQRPADAKTALEYICSCDSIPDPALRVLACLAEPVGS